MRISYCAVAGHCGQVLLAVAPEMLFVHRKVCETLEDARYRTVRRTGNDLGPLEVLIGVQITRGEGEMQPHEQK